MLDIPGPTSSLSPRAVMLARRLDLATVLGYLRTVQTFFETLFPHLGITSMAEWDAGRAMRASLRCEVSKVHTLEQRLRFWSTYTSISNHEHIWFGRLPDEDRRRYEVFVLPRVDPRDFKGLVPRVAAMVERKHRRKTETDAVLPYFIDLRTEAHLRFNRLMRVRAAYKRALQVLAERGPSVLPLEFTVDEGGDLERRLPPCERLHFRLWDRRSFILAHRDKYSNTTVCDARADEERQLTNGTVHSSNMWVRNGSWMMLRRRGCGLQTWSPEGCWAIAR